MGVTALLQQFLKLRAFVLKPYLHLERHAAVIIRYRKNIGPVLLFEALEAISKNQNKTANAKCLPSSTSL